MKKYTFAFHLNGHLAELSVVAEVMGVAEKLIRGMLPDQYFDDGLFLRVEEYDPHKYS